MNSKDGKIFLDAWVTKVKGYSTPVVSYDDAVHSVELAEEEIKKKAIEAFKFATDGYFIVGGTDYSGNRLNEFIEKLNS